MLFSVWNELNVCLSWDETEEWAQRLGLVTVPVLYRGIWDEDGQGLLYEAVRLRRGAGRLCGSAGFRICI